MLGHRPTYVEIDLAAIRHNLLEVRRRLGPVGKILAVVKADAYGHGAQRVAPVLAAAGADLFGVAIVEEGIELRHAGVRQPIIVLGGFYPGQELSLLQHELIPCLFDLESARRLETIAAAAGVIWPYHLKIDTGMGRIGFQPEELATVLPQLATLTHLRLDGVLSHLALADDPPHPLTAEQIAIFRSILDQVRAAGFAPVDIHLGNSATIFSRAIPECNVVRPGIVLYGAAPSAYFSGQLDLQPVMSFRSRIALLKSVPAGTGISYGHRYRVTRPSTIAAVPVGYADGYSRQLTNRGEVLVRGQRAPVAGTVCMDWIMVDVTAIPGVSVGDEVTLLGRDHAAAITAEEWAEKVGTISYEIFCNVSKRVPRIYRGQT
jgi:alanine racemase